MRLAGKAEISSSMKQRTSVRSRFFPQWANDWNKAEEGV
jgi:hypothetical protein